LHDRRASATLEAMARAAPVACFLPALVASIACSYPVLDDDARVCIAEPATDRLVLHAVKSCWGDHSGAEVSCTITAGSAGQLLVHTRQRDGKDPNDSCAGELVARCETEPLPPGEYQLVYGDAVANITLPGARDLCLEDGVLECDTDAATGSGGADVCDGTG
jgi:hypothetical protein